MKGLEKFRDQMVLIIGDMMVDKYIIGSVDRISPEAPVPVLRQKKVSRKLGGTGNVIINATSLGAKVRAIGRIGDDSEGTYFIENLRSQGVDAQYIFTSGSTIAKTRVSASNQQFIRIDEEMLNKLHVLANYEGRSVNSQILVLIRDNIKAFETENGEIKNDSDPKVNVKP